MMRSMSLAISALRNHQIFMDVISSNISNVNTTGYKGSRIGFQELLNQTLRGSSAPRGGLGGLNPIQIGLGMALAGVDTLFTQGNLQDTGKLTDLAIQGDGFFVLDNGENGYVYTRDGNLDMGLDGSLLNLATGLYVQGWAADEDGTIDTTQPLTSIRIPYGQSMARSTTAMDLRGNLDASSIVGDTGTVTASIYDSLGNAHDVEVTFTKSASNQWTWSVSSTDTAITGLTASGTTINFDADGSYAATNPATSLAVTFGNGADNTDVEFDFSNLTQLAGDGVSSLSTSNQNGLPPGELTSFNVSSSGQVVGVFSNGLNRTLGQLALATFINPGGLLKEGQNLFSTSANSGTAQIGLPAVDGRGQISAGYLEMSNVELAQQFTNMIIAQRGFQANSRVITSSDEMLQDLVNLKR
ncbi:MAG: flagellar hook protein FlgE [Chloroflexota bacterium]